MAQNRQSGALYIVWNNVIARVHGGGSLGGLHQENCSARAAAQRQSRRFARASHHPNDVVEQTLLDSNPGPISSRAPGQQRRIERLQVERGEIARIEALLEAAE